MWVRVPHGVTPRTLLAFVSNNVLFSPAMLGLLAYQLTVWQITLQQPLQLYVTYHRSMYYLWCLSLGRKLNIFYTIAYTLSHNYCEHHFLKFFGIFQILLYLWSSLFHCEIPMPYGVASVKIILICPLFNQILMLNFTIHSLYKFAVQCDCKW